MEKGNGNSGKPVVLRILARGNAMDGVWFDEKRPFLSTEVNTPLYKGKEQLIVSLLAREARKIMNDGKMFYPSFYDALQDIKDPVEYQKTVNAVMGYAFYGIEPDLQNLDSIGRIIYKMSKPVIDSNNKRKEDGTKGGRRPGVMKMETTGDSAKKDDTASMRTNGSGMEQYGNQHGNSGKARPETATKPREPEKQTASDGTRSRSSSVVSAEPSQVKTEPIKKAEPQVYSQQSEQDDSSIDRKRIDEWRAITQQIGRNALAQ